MTATPFDEAETVELPLPHPNAEFIQGLREVADWFEANPQLPRKYGEYMCLFFHDKAALQAALPGLGKLEKVKDEDYFKLLKNFTGGTRVSLLLDHEKMCERRVVGTKTIPAREGYVVPEHTVPPEPEKTVDVYEWVCPDSILAPTGVARIAE